MSLEKNVSRPTPLRPTISSIKPTELGRTIQHSITLPFLTKSAHLFHLYVITFIPLNAMSKTQYAADRSESHGGDDKHARGRCGEVLEETEQNGGDDDEKE